MTTLVDWLRDVFGYVLAAVGGWVTFATVKLYKNSERLAVLEKAVTDMVKAMPANAAELRAQIAADIDELKAELGDMRNEGRQGRTNIHARIEALRLEIKTDINRESDKRRLAD